MKRHRLAHPSTQARFVRNIRAVLRQATAEEVSAGVGWYPTATRGCHIWAKQYGLDAQTVASVIAALSPQLEWMSNLRHALNMVSGSNAAMTGASRPLQANIRKARQILADNALLPDNYFKVANKVCAFARNLQGQLDVVTVDTHAAQIAMSNPVPGDAAVKLSTFSKYAAFASAYRTAAALEGIAPSELQAITWLTWKRLYPATRKRALLRKAA